MSQDTNRRTGIFAAAVLWACAVHAAPLPKVKVFFRQNGKVSVMQIMSEACRKGEPRDACLDRVAAQDCPRQGSRCLPSRTMERSELPKDGSARDQWRGSQGKGVWIDDSVVTKRERIRGLQQQLDAELVKSAPDPIAAARLQRQIEKEKEKPEDSD